MIGENTKHSKIKVGIVGANGYSGLELIRLLTQHPFVEIEMLMSHSTEGIDLKEIAPHLARVCELPLEKVDINVAVSRVDCLFFATPAGVSQTLIPKFISAGITCIDLSGDFRLKDASLYEKWYQRQAAGAVWLQQAIYGLPEWTGGQIKGEKLISNPGCYPTATLLGVLPAVQKGLINPRTLVIDGKSGASGAGRRVSSTTHYCEVNESVAAYKIGLHQHIPEIEQMLQCVSGENVTISFSTHLIPMTRGLMCTMVAQLNQTVTTEEMIDAYKTYYEPHPFVRVMGQGIWPSTKQVMGSNFCDIGLYCDERTNRVTIVSVIDNVVKGASGQAIQNMNLVYGWDEKTGLMLAPLFP